LCVGDPRQDESVSVQEAIMSGTIGSREDRQVGVDLGLTNEEKNELRKIAQTVIEHRILNKPLPDFEGKTPKLKEKRGAFVTLHKSGQLRGCIGNIRGRHPLYETVARMAEEAAFHDPRFPALSKEELKDIDIEISALTPLRRVDKVDEITVGKHGIYIEKGFFSGLLLPQVATEHGWDRQTFLEQTCFKAGLHKDAWKEKDTKVYVFSADVF
jgi:AmmeMemoRadiSam system protein A